MLTKLRKSKSEGFTIIEVMIVLAIAALILLIVLLAVPALQRSARNNQRKADVTAVTSEISTFLGNNNGTLPTGYSGSTAGEVISCAVGGTGNAVIATTACGAGNSETGKIGYYSSNGNPNIYINNRATAVTPVTITLKAVGNESTTAVTSASMIIVQNESCPDTIGGTTATGTYTSRNAAVFYALEGSGNAGDGTMQCANA